VTIEKIENRDDPHRRLSLIRLFVYEYLTGGGIDPELAGESGIADLSVLIVEGRAMRDAMVQDLRDLGGIDVSFASSRFEAAAASRSPLQHYCAAPGEPMMEFVARAAREHDYAWIVAPECDGLMLQLADAVGAARWLGCTKVAIALCSSKRQTAALLATHGIAVTPALDAEGMALDGTAASRRDVNADGAAGWVVKPDDGAGGLDTYRFDNFAEARADFTGRLAAGRKPVLQEWVNGDALSLSLICSATCNELISINRQRIGVADTPAAGHAGRVIEFDGVDVDCIDQGSAQGRTLAALAQRVTAALPGLRGFVGIDVVWRPDGEPVVIEVNPRVTMAYVGLSARLKRNLAAQVLAAHGVKIAPATADDALHAPVFAGRAAS